MTMTGLKAFDDTIHTTNTWLHEITSRMGWDDRRRGYRLLRLGLHAIRDQMSANEIAHVSAQLPLLVRGIFFEGWQPARPSTGVDDIEEFLSGIRDAFSDIPGFEAEAGFRELISVMRMHLTDGLMENMRSAMPEAIRPLWDDEF